MAYERSLNHSGICPKETRTPWRSLRTACVEVKSFCNDAVTFLTRLGGIDAAIDVERCSCDEAVELACQKDRRPRHLLGCAGPSDRNAGDGGLRGFRGGVRGMKGRSQNEAGSERIDPHAVRAELLGEGACKGQDRAFGGGVGEGPP